MKRRSIDKRYIFFRDMQKCYYCHKNLKLKQITLDHYLPKSMGGTDDYFNLVTCCKRCNKFKGRTIPVDVEEVHMDFLKKAIVDGKITISIKSAKSISLIHLINRITFVESKGSISEIRGEDFSLYIEKNRVIRADGKVMDYLVGGNQIED